MNRRLLLLIFIFIHTYSFAQKQPDSSSLVSTLDEVVISGTKFSGQKKFVAQKIDVLSKQYISKVNAQNTGDLLISTGNVYVQKSQQGGSSPVLRGFEASRVLLVIDGIRLNNLIYRAGHLQNVITVDQNMLESVEVMYGPASTLYGSDALGGVIHLRTKAPKLSGDKNFLATGSGFVRYSSANDEKTAHVDVSLGGKKFAWLQAYNYSYFGDMKMGDNYPSKYPNFGRRDSFMTNINGVDTVLKNSDDRVQRFSGYKQWDILQKFLFQQNEKISHTLNLQFSNSSDVPRYDRLQDKRNGTLRYAEWYYGPQKRNMYSYEFNAKNLDGFFSDIRANLSYQDIEESRQTREFKRYNQFDSRVEKVKVGAFVIDARKKYKYGELTVGIDGQFNDLTSIATRSNLLTGSVSKLDTRYPDGKNKMNYVGLFAQNTYRLAGEKLILNEGLRVQSVSLHSTLVDTALLFHLPYTDIKQNKLAVTGNLGLVYLPVKATKLSLSFSTGFRSPNIDDLAKIFESSTASRQLVVPNTDIKPEYTYNVDLGINQLIAEKIRIEVNGFYTWFRNAIVKAPFTLNGQDSVVYYGVKSQVLASQNRNKAYIYGVSANATVEIIDGLTAFASFNYTKGRFQTDAAQKSGVYQKQSNGTYSLVQANVTSKPLDHIPPVFGKASLQYAKKAIIAEAFLLYNGWKKLDEFNADGEDNAQYATADGMPSWSTLNFRASYTLKEKITLQVAVENITDRNYRYFASGFSAPGRNFIVSLRGNF